MAFRSSEVPPLKPRIIRGKAFMLGKVLKAVIPEVPMNLWDKVVSSQIGQEKQ